MRPRAGRLLLALALFAIACMLLVRLGDMDLFSHMGVGRWIVAHHQVPTRDPFAYSSAGPFRYTEALADVILYAIQSIGGNGGLWFFQAVIGFVVLSLVVARARGSSPARLFVAALVIVASFAAMALKPQVFSYVMFAAILLALERAPALPPMRLLWLPLAFAAWGNLHRAGIFGLSILGVTAVAWWFLTPKHRQHALYLGAATVLSALALLLNSGGTYYFTSAFDVVNRSSFHKIIAEWQPLTADVVLHRHPALLPLLALAAIEYVRRRKLDAELLVLLATLGLATKGARLLPFVAIAAAPAAVRAVDAGATWLANRARPVFASALLVLIALALPAVNYLEVVPPAFRGAGASERMLPIELASYLAEHRPPGHLFHSFNFGGYFVWALAPETPVLFDGRNDTVYDDTLFNDVVEAESSPRAFAALDARFHFAVAAFQWSSPGDRRAAFLDSRWVLIYWDDLSQVYANRERASDVRGYAVLDPRTAFARVQQPDDALIADLRRNTTDAPRSVRAHTLLAIALANRNDPAADAEQAIATRLAREKGLE